MDHFNSLEELYEEYSKIDSKNGLKIFVKKLIDISSYSFTAHHEYFKSSYISTEKEFTSDFNFDYPRNYDLIDAMIFRCRRYFIGRDLTIESNLIKQYFYKNLSSQQKKIRELLHSDIEFEDSSPEEDFKDEIESFSDSKEDPSYDEINVDNVYEFLNFVSSYELWSSDLSALSNCFKALKEVHDRGERLLGSQCVSHTDAVVTIIDLWQKLIKTKKHIYNTRFLPHINIRPCDRLSTYEAIIEMRMSGKPGPDRSFRNHLACILYERILKDNHQEDDKKYVRQKYLDKIMHELVKRKYAKSQDERAIRETITEHRKPEHIRKRQRRKIN